MVAHWRITRNIEFHKHIEDKFRGHRGFLENFIFKIQQWPLLIV